MSRTLPDSTAAAARSFVTGCICSDRRPRRPRPLDLPCRHDPALWFAESPADLERAKALCADCPVRLACLAVAIRDREFAGVWGGHIIERGRIVPYKRARGRPRKTGDRAAIAGAPPPPVQEQDMIAALAPAGQDRLGVAAAHLYDAECALHTAHQSGVDAWIAAATQKLHEAVTEYLATIRTHPDRGEPA